MVMRILHTSDWHLGRSFGDFRMLEDQRSFLDWLATTAATEQVDLVVIAGDLYDRAIPPADAVALFSDVIRRLRAAGAEVVAIAGNHDSGERIGALDGIVEDGLIVRGGFESSSSVVVREFHDGPLAIVATPFLEPLLTPVAVRAEMQGELDPELGRTPRISHEMVLRHALDEARSQIEPGMRSIVLSHAFVTGAAPCESERDLAVGDSGMVSASLYDGFSYVALGHLHRPQLVAGHEHIRYSGSPLPFSFSETHGKSVVIVDMAIDGSVSAADVPVPVGRRVHTIRGSFDEILALPPIIDAWVKVELTDTVVIPDAHRQLKTRFPWLAEIHRIGRSELPGRRLTAADLTVRTPVDLAHEFYAEVSSADAGPEVTTILDRAVAEATFESSNEYGAA